MSAGAGRVQRAAAEHGPKRIQRQRTAGWRMPEGAVYVGRPSRWGNPFKLGTRMALARVPAVRCPEQPWEYEGRISAAGMRHDYFHPGGKVTVVNVRYMTLAETIACYRALLNGGGWPLDFTHNGGYYPTAEEARAELRGKDLACWCPLDQPCHADVLLEIANTAAISSSSGSGSNQPPLGVGRVTDGWPDCTADEAVEAVKAVRGSGRNQPGEPK